MSNDLLLGIFFLSFIAGAAVAYSIVRNKKPILPTGPWKLKKWEAEGVDWYCYQITNALGDQCWLNSDGHETFYTTRFEPGCTFFKSLKEADQALDKWFELTVESNRQKYAKSSLTR